MACHMRTPLALLVGGLACHGAAGQEAVQQLDPMVVVATRPASTLEVTLDPKKPGSPHARCRWRWLSQKRHWHEHGAQRGAGW